MTNNSVGSDKSALQQKQPQQQRQPRKNAVDSSTWCRVVVYLLCLAVYLIPLLTHSHDGTPVLDELHIMSQDNQDISGTTDWKLVFVNDYWGRPMNSPSSHKSWRPLTVLTFRWLSLDGGDVLLGHRLFNIITHAATAHVVSIVACLLFPQTTQLQGLVLALTSPLVFGLHPTHVEITANAANRNHLLAVLCSCILVDPRIDILVLLLFQILGLLCSETFLFQTPAILVTMTAISYRRTQKEERAGDKSKSTTSMASTMLELAPRYFLIVLLTATYLGGRYWFDAISIPDGLIRPAENPFFEFQGWRRARNYSYVLVLHVLKSLCLDMVGFSHEYGYNCIPEIDSLLNPRMLLVLGLVIVVVVVSYKTIFRQGLFSHPSLLWLVWMAWFATLFPISGLVKVGTFVADRIVVASTVAFSIFVGKAVSDWIVDNSKQKLHRGKTAVVVLLLVFLWGRVHVRTMEWMDSVSLLQSSLRTCPESAKSNLELSKVYSGLYPELTNMTYARMLLNKAHGIDPDYCDFHQQMAQLEFQEGNYLEFERHLVKGIMCPYTMNGCVPLWQQYWQIAKREPGAQARYDKYSLELQNAIEQAKKEESSK